MPMAPTPESAAPRTKEPGRYTNSRRWLPAGTATLTVCGDALASGGSADLVVEGAPPSTFAAVVLPLLVAELGLRAFDLAQGRSVRARANWYWAFEPDRFLSYRHRPNVDITLTSGVHMDPNSAGFRDAEIPIEPAEPRRLVICIGESSTWGFRARDRRSTWPTFTTGTP